MNNIPSHSSKLDLWIPSHPEFYTRDTLKHLFLNQEGLWGAHLQVPSAAPPGSSSSGQGKAARHPGTSFLLLENTTEESLAEGKNTLAMIPHPEMESWCNWNTYMVLGNYLDPTTWGEPRHNSAPHSSTLPLNLLCSFGDCPKKSLKLKT